MQRNISTRIDGATNPHLSPVGYSLRALTRISARWPRFILGLVILASCACVGYSFFFLRFKTDRADFIDPNTEHHKRWATYAAAFDQTAEVIVVVEAETSDEIRRVLDEVADRLKREPEHFSNVLYKFESGPLQRKWLQYVRPEQLRVGLQRINNYAPVVRGETGRLELAGLYTQLTNQIDTRLAAAETSKPLTASENKRLFRQVDILTTSLDHSLTNPDDFLSPWPDLVPIDTQTRALKEQVSYFLSDRGTMGYLRVVPRRNADDPNGDWPALARLEEINTEVAEAHPGCKIGLTGVPILESDEMRRSRFELGLALLVAVGGCLLVMGVGFRGIRHPLLTLVMLAASIAWALGFTTAMVGHLNTFSLAVVAVLLGLGLDFAIAYTARYLQLRREGWQLRPALMESTSTTGAASMTAAVTTALAFLCTLLTEYVGVAELGIIAAAGIMLCALGVFFVLPALISLADQNTDASRLPRPIEGERTRRLLGRFPLVTLCVSAVIVAGFALQIAKIDHRRIVSRVRFDANLLNLHAQDADAVRLERRLYEESSNPLLYAVSIADSERQMREMHAKFERLPSVAHVESLAMRLPNPGDETRQLLAQYRSQLGYLPNQVPALRSSDPAAVGKAVENFYVHVKKYADNETAQRLAKTADGFLGRFEKLTLDDQTRFLNQFQYRMAVDLLNRFHTVRYAANDERIEASELPGDLVSRYVSTPDADGKRKWLLHIFPKEKVWDEAPLTKFIGELRSVDPNITGTPIHNFESTRQIRHSYETAALYAFAAVWVVLLLDFLGRDKRWLVLLPTLAVTVLAAVMLHSRHIGIDPMLFAFSYVVVTGAIGLVVDAGNVRNALLAFLVPIAGGLMMFGIFALAHVDLNPANLLVLPLVLGIGVNYGVHVMHDYRNQKGAYQMSSSVFSTLVLTSLTSIVGFGSMMIASHRGLFTLGLALAIGIASCLFVALVLVPSLLSVMTSRSGKATATTSRSDSQGAKRVDTERKARAA